MSAPATAPARRVGRNGSYARTHEAPVRPAHKAAVTAFHSGGHDAPAGAHARKAALTLVNELLCGWCDQSRVDPRVCRCQRSRTS